MPIPAALLSLSQNPMWQAVISKIGQGFLDDMFGSTTPYEQSLQQYGRAAQSVLPQLQAQARGEPTAGTRAIQQQVQQQGQRFGQSFAASQRRAGQLGGTPAATTPYRAQSERMQVGQQQALTQMLGQHQQSAQSQLLGLGPTTLAAQERFMVGEEERMNRNQAALGNWARKHVSGGTPGAPGQAGLQAQDPQSQEMWSLLKEIFSVLRGDLFMAAPGE